MQKALPKREGFFLAAGLLLAIRAGKDRVKVQDRTSVAAYCPILIIGLLAAGQPRAAHHEEIIIVS
ncbi:hypothetical protein [Aquitalea sp.]|uniref:hypothetical protein n=1 Tax=Aquitalea sp. TaxID=1872623 RepID=UPI00258BD4B4|nr:hypothetical protein [Aquitalea sp.]